MPEGDALTRPAHGERRLPRFTLFIPAKPRSWPARRANAASCMDHAGGKHGRPRSVSAPWQHGGRVRPHAPRRSPRPRGADGSRSGYDVGLDSPPPHSRSGLGQPASSRSSLTPPPLDRDRLPPRHSRAMCRRLREGFGGRRHIARPLCWLDAGSIRLSDVNRVRLRRSINTPAAAHNERLRRD